jgi:hypothetical protein
VRTSMPFWDRMAIVVGGGRRRLRPEDCEVSGSDGGTARRATGWGAMGVCIVA